MRAIYIALAFNAPLITFGENLRHQIKAFRAARVWIFVFSNYNDIGFRVVKYR